MKSSLSTPSIREEPRDVPVVHECDLCVVGGSCTGVFAAVRAARLGLRVALIENNGFFGGVATAGMVTIWHPLLDANNEQTIIGGLTAELIERLKRRQAVLVADPPRIHCGFTFNAEEMKIDLDELVKEHGIRPFLHTRFVAPVVEGDRLRAVIVEDKTGRRAIAARMFIDATGDGDVAARMGLPFEQRENLQPPTLVAIFENYAEIRRKNPDFNLMAEVHDPRRPQALKNGFVWGAAVPGRPEAYMVAGTRAHHANCADADQLTEATLECRRQVRVIGDILRNHVAGGERLTLANLASYIGIRETRHILCQHRLTEQEVLLGTRFPDAIANGTYGVDIHHSEKPGITMRYLDGTEIYNVPGQPAQKGRWRDASEGTTPFYQIPYRCLVPRGATNLLVAGRLIDADRGAYGAIRVMVNCNQTGEAAGVACWLALKGGLSVAEVDPARLRATLTDGGSIIL